MVGALLACDLGNLKPDPDEQEDFIQLLTNCVRRTAHEFSISQAIDVGLKMACRPLVHAEIEREAHRVARPRILMRSQIVRWEHLENAAERIVFVGVICE